MRVNYRWLPVSVKIWSFKMVGLAPLRTAFRRTSRPIPLNSRSMLAISALLSSTRRKCQARNPASTWATWWYTVSVSWGPLISEDESVCPLFPFHFDVQAEKQWRVPQEKVILPPPRMPYLLDLAKSIESSFGISTPLRLILHTLDKHSGINPSKRSS